MSIFITVMVKYIQMDQNYSTIGSNVTIQKKNKKPLIIGIIVCLVVLVAGIVLIMIQNNSRKEEDQKAVACVTKYRTALSSMSNFFESQINGEIRTIDLVHKSTVLFMDETNENARAFRDELYKINTDKTSRDISNAIQQIRTKLDVDIESFEKMYDEYQYLMKLYNEGNIQQIISRYELSEDFDSLKYENVISAKILNCDRILFQYDEAELLYEWDAR